MYSYIHDVYCSVLTYGFVHALLIVLIIVISMVNDSKNRVRGFSQKRISERERELWSYCNNMNA